MVEIILHLKQRTTLNFRWEINTSSRLSLNIFVIKAPCHFGLCSTWITEALKCGTCKTLLLLWIFKIFLKYCQHLFFFKKGVKDLNSSLIPPFPSIKPIKIWQMNLSKKPLQSFILPIITYTVWIIFLPVRSGL